MEHSRTYMCIYLARVSSSRMYFVPLSQYCTYHTARKCR